MKTKKSLAIAAMSSFALFSSLTAQSESANMPSQEEMWQMIQAQQKQIEALKALIDGNNAELATAKSEVASTREELKTTQKQIEATSLAVEEIGESSFGSAGWWKQTSIGGYGELHANFPQDGENEIDFHRFVLFVNHEFNDWITLYSELEVEHSIAGDGQNGEVELEQAFVRLDWTEQFSTDAGLFLMPVGILNETHEPNTFYGVERNNIESRIIPSTWWEAGLKGTYRFDNGIAVDAALVSGLDMPATGVIRSGRQKVSEAVNEEAAFVSRVKYTGIAGLEVAASVFYQDDVAQSSLEEVSGLMTEAHIDYTKGGFRVRALYARWDLDGTTSADAEEQYGYYIEPSYRWTFSEQYGDLGAYFRFSDYEYFTGTALSENKIYEFGLNYWPTENVVFKADLQFVDDSDQYSGDGDYIYNLGFGFQF